MTRNDEYLRSLVLELTRLPKETGWLEFKKNVFTPQDTGEYISALANSAALAGKAKGYLIWGVHNTDHSILGTTGNPGSEKVGNEELENWLLRLLSPKIGFHFQQVDIDSRSVVILEIDRAFRHPVQFSGVDYIRIGSLKKKLKEFQEKERELWRVLDDTPFELLIAAERVTGSEVIELIDYPAYFDLMRLPLPTGADGVLAALETHRLIQRLDGNRWNLFNVSAILFARRLRDFSRLERKAVRFISYDGTGRTSPKAAPEQVGTKGYAAGFNGLIGYINSHLPKNEVIGQALRQPVTVYPELAIRELVANAIIHQDFSITGNGPMVELFSDRMEITNPGKPLGDPQRLLDHPPRSRNETLASLMRRMSVCEERGSGVDKVVLEAERYQLPAPAFEIVSDTMRSTLFTPRSLVKMDSTDRIRAVYLHACLRYVERDFMTNTTVRSRFGISEQNSATASRLIREALDAGEIRLHDEGAAPKFRKYVPKWVI
jgi:ATP-dependent DNA helicase RecG